MTKMYKTLLFDLDNTLIDDDENRKHAIKKVLMRKKETITSERIQKFIEIDNKFWQDRAAGKIKDPYIFKSKEEKTEWVRAQRFLIFFSNITFEDGVMLNNEYMNYLKEKIIPIKHAQEIIKYLYKKQYEIYIITNGPTKAVGDKINKIDLNTYIKGIFTAEEAGCMKPRREFFEKFFKKINESRTERMLIIGDELDKDIAGGIQNGIDSCWLNSKKIKNTTIYKPSYEINDLIELKNFL